MDRPIASWRTPGGNGERAMAAAVGLGEDLAAEWVSKRVEAVRDTRRRPAAVGPERGAFSSLDGAPSDDVRCLPGQAQLRARPLAPLF
jgi:hypothetical protein